MTDWGSVELVDFLYLKGFKFHIIHLKSMFRMRIINISRFQIEMDSWRYTHIYIYIYIYILDAQKHSQIF